jgi:uncharacterized protein
VPKVTESKYQKLQKRLKELKSVVIGFSGGIDSTLLLKMSLDTLGAENVWAVTGDSESLLPEELSECEEMAAGFGLDSSHFIKIKTEELQDENYRQNPSNRCFFCKKELFTKLQEIAEQVGADYVLDGSNSDDLDDWRPGRQAAAELNVASPLAESGFTKEDIRNTAKELGLPNWEKPALACLASRIPYGSEVTVEKLNQVADAERFLKSLGFTQLRVRHHDKMARIELIPDEIYEIFDNDLIKTVTERLKQIGFTYVTIDLEGYRSGSMNELLHKDSKK